MGEVEDAQILLEVLGDLLDESGFAYSCFPDQKDVFLVLDASQNLLHDEKVL